MIRRWAGAVIAGLAALTVSPSGAATVLECGDWASAGYLIEPWEETTRTFSRGSVRVAIVDLGEPECCPHHIAVLIPANMYGGRACFLIAKNRLVPNGWVKVGLDEASASRGAEPGLRILIPVYGYDPATGGADPASRQMIALRIRQAAGTVDLETVE